MNATYDPGAYVRREYGSAEYARAYSAVSAALREESGELIVDLYAMPLPELEALLEAAQRLDSEIQDVLERRREEKQ